MLNRGCTHWGVAKVELSSVIQFQASLQDVPGRYGRHFFREVSDKFRLHTLLYSHNKNHLLPQFAIVVILRAYLPIKV